LWHIVKLGIPYEDVCQDYSGQMLPHPTRQYLDRQSKAALRS
jgi:hypothetical protein